MYVVSEEGNYEPQKENDGVARGKGGVDELKVRRGKLGAEARKGAIC